MAEVSAYPDLVTTTPWTPPAVPFRWHPVRSGDVIVEYLVDADGHQLFLGASAVWRKAEDRQPGATDNKGVAHG